MGLKNHSLKDRVVVVTHPIKKDDELVCAFKNHKIQVVKMPLISTKAIPFQLHNSLGYYSWVVFTSKNALHPFFDSVEFGDAKIATIGDATNQQLQNLGYNSDFVGSGKSGGHFVQELKSVFQPGEKILLVLGELASDVLEIGLSDDYKVDRINVYNTLKPVNIDESILRLIAKDAYDLITVTSPSAVHHLFSLLSGSKQKLRLASIGIITTAAIETYGQMPAVEAGHQSYAGVSEVVIEWLRRNKKTNL